MSESSVEIMTTTTACQDVARTGSTDRLPWVSLLVLGAATLVMVTTEMLPTAVLSPMSAGLGVPETQTAQLVSAWALLVVLSSFPLVRLTRGRNRRNVVAVGLVGLALSSALTALAPSYLAALGARSVGALAVGLLWATVNAHVADLVSDRMLGRAVAVVLGGATLGMVLGTPVGRLVADQVGWRTAFAGLAIVAGSVAVAVRVLVGSTPGRALVVDRSAEVTARLEPDRGSDRSALRRMLLTTGLVALWLVGHYAAYTFVTRLAERPAAALPGGIGTLLLVFGIASAAGVALAGRFGAHRGALATYAGLTGLAVLALLVPSQLRGDRGALLGIGVILAWGVLSGAVPPLAQTAILRAAGPTHRAMAGALIPVLFNGGIAIGAALGALVVREHGVEALPLPTAVVIVLAAASLALLTRRANVP